MAARELAMDRAAGICEAQIARVCLGRAVNAHHRDPRGMGGTRLKNRRPETAAAFLGLCGSGTTGCHGYLEQHRTFAKLRGWLIPDGADPTLHPLLYRGRWCYLTAGSVILCPPAEALMLTRRLRCG